MLSLLKDVTNANFGLLIAYIIPGFVVVSALSPHVPVLQIWMLSPATELPSVGGLVYTTLYSVLAGMFVSTLRWLTIDSIHARMGLQRKSLNFNVLHDRVAGYDIIVGNTYRYYQHYANMLTAAPLAWLLHLTAFGWHFGIFVFLLAFMSVYWLASKDTLRNYFARTEMLLGEIPTQSQPDRAIHSQ